MVRYSIGAVTDIQTEKWASDLETQIQSLQQHLQSPAESGGTAAPKLALTEALRLKRVVDNFRLFLWAYNEAWSSNRTDTKAVLQRIRLQAVADMMNLLHPELAGKGLPDSTEGRAVRQALRSFSQTVL